MKQKIVLTMFALWLLSAASSKQTFALGEKSAAAQDTLPTTTPETAVTMAERINNYRTELGLPAYYQDEALTQASQWVVDTMAVTEFISHFDDTGAGPQQRAEKAGYDEHVTEIIFGGYGGANAAWEWWLENELHHTLLTSEDYVEFGVATAVSEQGRQFWAIMVGFGDGHYDTSGLANNNSTPDVVTKLPSATSTFAATAVATSTVTQPKPTATSEQIAHVTETNNPETTDNNTANTNQPASSSFEESGWLIIAAALTIIVGIAIFYFPRIGLNQKFKERT
jgi:uncharacterized protein YkwD